MKNINEAYLKDKNVIIRCDLNVPIKDNKILDDTRIVKSLKTINNILKYANKIIILSHLGRIKNEKDKKNNSLFIVKERLEKLLDKNIGFYDYTCKTKKELNNKIVLFENTRFFDLDNKKESNCSKELSKYFSSFGDIFINDAFGTTHRKNASNYGITKYLPSYKGYLIMEEEQKLKELLYNVNKPFIVILGGKKVEDKIGLINNLIKRVDKFIITGAMSFTFLKAQGYNVGRSIVDESNIRYAKRLLKKYKDKIILIEDCIVSNNSQSIKELRNINEIKDDEIGFDVGPKTIDIYKEILKDANTIFFNGPLGLFENKEFETGTKELINYLKTLNSNIIIGGGDTINAAKKYGLKNAYLSTGGGATLQYLEKGKLKF